jgi:hypothetical protein
MNNTENEVLYQKALRFSEEDNSVAGQAAKELARVLEERIKRTKFSTGSFYSDALDFLSITPDELNKLDNESVIRFFDLCRKNEAISVIVRFVDICTSSWFTITVKKLSLLGEQLAIAGFKGDGARCFDRAREIVLSTPDPATEE